MEASECAARVCSRSFCAPAGLPAVAGAGVGGLSPGLRQDRGHRVPSLGQSDGILFADASDLGFSRSLFPACPFLALHSHKTTFQADFKPSLRFRASLSSMMCPPPVLRGCFHLSRSSEDSRAPVTCHGPSFSSAGSNV